MGVHKETESHDLCLLFTFVFTCLFVAFLFQLVLTLFRLCFATVFALQPEL